MTPPTTGTTAVATRGLGKRFGSLWALAHVDLEIDRGQALLVAGSNGSGKTTLLKLLAGLYRPTAGSLTVLGIDPVGERLACRRQLSMVGHHSCLYERLSALESLRFWARSLGRSNSDSELVELLGEVGLAERRDSLVSTYSAGMRKRLALARSRLEEPSLLLLDEPFAALDVAGQRQVEAWVERGRENGMTIVLASHQLEQAAAVCDRAVLLEQGQMIWKGTACDLPSAFDGSVRR